MDREQEYRTKLARVRTFLDREGLRGLLLASHAGFAWLTGGGRNYVGTATERGVAGILVAPDRAVLLADGIERIRLQEEELAGLDLEVREYRWWSSSFDREAAALVPEGLAADLPLPGARVLTAAEAIALRNPLLPAEIDRYRALGEQVGVVLTHVAFHCRPALAEHQLAGMLAKGLMDFGMAVPVVLVAVDERVFSRRHPLPTGRPLERCAMLVVVARRDGLHVSATRLVHFGPVPAELRERHAACCRVEAAMLAATTPGRPLAEVFRAAQEAYAVEGCPDEWQRHHQGGPTGYAGRDLRAIPGCAGAVQLHQAFAWNPSIAGTKSEDTVLVTEAGLEVLSPTPDLPTLRVEAGGREWVRPAILER